MSVPAANISRCSFRIHRAGTPVRHSVKAQHLIQKTSTRVLFLWSFWINHEPHYRWEGLSRVVGIYHCFFANGAWLAACLTGALKGERNTWNLVTLCCSWLARTCFLSELHQILSTEILSMQNGPMWNLPAFLPKKLPGVYTPDCYFQVTPYINKH